MLIYGVKISDIKKYNEQKAERFFEILQKTNASNIAEKYFLDKTKNDGTFGDFLSNFDEMRILILCSPRSNGLWTTISCMLF